MTDQTLTMAPVSAGTAPPLAVGRYHDAAGQRQFLSYSLLEAERGRIAALRVLRTFHFRTGGNVLLTSMWDESAQLLPVERAIMSHGMVVVSADSSWFDAGRVESIARRFPLKGAMAIGPGTLEGLGKMGHDPAKLFADMVVWARPGAYETLVAIPGLNVHRCMELGPAFAMECAAKSGAHVDAHEWKVEAIDGEIVLTSLLERTETFTRLHTGLRGRIVEGVCACGSADPRVILE